VRSLVQFGCAVLLVGVVAFAFAGAAGKAAKMTPMKMETEVTVTMKQAMPMPGGKGKPGGPPPGPMTMTQTMWFKSASKSRMEMTMPMLGGAGGGKTVSITDGENMFIINDAQKSVQKMSKSSLMKVAKSMGFGPGAMDYSAMSDPKQVEAQLAKMGIKKTGAEKVGAEMCDVYKGKVGQGQMAMDMTMWLRQSDHLPAKSVGSNAMTDVVSQLKKVEKNPPMPDSLFVVPAGYEVKEEGDLGIVIAKAQGKAQQTACLSNMKNLALAIRMYAADHNRKLPDYKKWEQEIKAYVKNPEVLKCAAAKSKGPHYRLNSKCQGEEKAIDGAGTIMLFECDEKGKPVYRHDGTINLAFADGHCKAFGKGGITPGMWTPQAGD